MKIIAEAGSNHNGDLERALALVDAAADLGCEAVKFQQFQVEKLFRNRVDRKDWELPEEFNKPIAERAKEHGILFGSTPFYWEAIGLLEPLVDFFKVSSYQILWLDFLREIAKTGKPVFLSTGMATMGEIKEAVDVFEGKVTLMHCVSQYPADPAHVNLKAIRTLSRAFGCDVGWSDHTGRVGVLYRAGLWGARWAELHLDLDGMGYEYEQGHCWLPDDVIDFSRVQDWADDSDGDGVKRPMDCELLERAWRTDPVDGLRPILGPR